MSATPGQNTGLAGSPLRFGLGILPGLLSGEQARARGRILDALSAEGGRTAERVGQSAAQAATARGLTGGIASSFQQGRVNSVLQNLALQEAQLENQFLSEDIQGLAQIAQLVGTAAGTAFGGPAGAAVGSVAGQAVSQGLGGMIPGTENFVKPLQTQQPQGPQATGLGTNLTQLLNSLPESVLEMAANDPEFALPLLLSAFGGTGSAGGS